MGQGFEARWRLRVAVVLLVIVPVVPVIACGGSEPELLPAAEPAESPPESVRPAGKVAAIGAGAEGLIYVPGSNLVAVGLREPYRLAFFDPDSLKVESEVFIPNPLRHLGISPDSKLVAAPAESANTFYEVSAERGIVSEVATGEFPHDADYAADKIFVADEFGDTVTVIEEGEVIATLPAPAQPGGIAATDEGLVAMITVSERLLTVYDGETNEELGEIPAGTGPTHIEALGNEAFVADTEGDVIRRFRIDADPQEIETVPAEGVPYGIAIDPRRKILWVTLTATNQLAGYSIGETGMRRIATYPTVQQPNTVTVDPASGKVFIVSRTLGLVQRISPAAEDRR